MTDEWYIARDGQTFGPYTPEQVQELSRIQPLLPTDQMLRAGTQEWRPALTIEELFASPPSEASEPPIEPTPEASLFMRDEPSSPARSRRKPVSRASMPLWSWLGPVGGAVVLGLLTASILFFSRSKPPAPRKEERRSPAARRPPVEKAPSTNDTITKPAPPAVSISEFAATSLGAIQCLPSASLAPRTPSALS